MILPSIAGSMNLIIMVTFFRGLPDELLEAAKIDGAGEVRIFFQVALPLSKTIISTVCIFAFVGSWNNYLWPLLCAMSENLFTLPIGIPTLAGTYTVDYVVPLTASMVASLPMIIIYIIFEKTDRCRNYFRSCKRLRYVMTRGRNREIDICKGILDSNHDPLPLYSVLWI